MHGKLRVVLHFGSFSLSLKNHKVPCTIPLAQLPLHLSNARPNPPEFLKQEATLAVQGTPPLSDFLPVNKFSSAPLLMEVVRVVQARSIALALRRWRTMTAKEMKKSACLANQKLRKVCCAELSKSMSCSSTDFQPCGLEPPAQNQTGAAFIEGCLRKITGICGAGRFVPEYDGLISTLHI